LRVTRRFELEEIGGAFVYVKRHGAREASGMNIVRVLVVDDSPYVARSSSRCCCAALHRVVGTARDGVEALEQVAELNSRRGHVRPEHAADGRHRLRPRADGAAPGADHHHQRRESTPARRCSPPSTPAPSTSCKATALATDKLLDIADELVEKVKAQHRPRFVWAPAAAARHRAPAVTTKGRVEIVLIGTSTGGRRRSRSHPRAAGDFPVPIGLVLHMPIGYTETYAAN
jgi:two-component system chemotaxis response regulator CheB